MISLCLAKNQKNIMMRKTISSEFWQKLEYKNMTKNIERFEEEVS